jgi:cephalosporin hydroxylase
MKRYINDIITTAYTRHDLLQYPNEFTKFCEFYYSLNCKNVLEVGSYLGGTFYVLCKLSHPDGLKISIDYPFYGNQAKEIADKKVYSKMKSFAENVHIITADSHLEETKNVLSDILKEEKLDFLFIDGDHSYEGVKQDFKMYSPFVKKGGYVAFHDVNDTKLHRELGCYVHQFWEELPNKNKIEFNSKSKLMGIGVIKII